MIALFLGFTLFSAAPGLCAPAPLDAEIAAALRRAIPCEKLEVKTKATETGSGKLTSLLIKFTSVSNRILPADYITVQYANPLIDLAALKASGAFHVTSYSDFKIGVLVSAQTLKNEFAKTAKRLNMPYNKFSIKFTPPYVELEFDIPAGGISPEHRQIVEKYVKNKKFEGYAALRLELRDNMIIASPAKVILNHFLLPTPVVDEIARRVNPLYHIPRIRPFDYSLERVGVQQKYIFFGN